MAENYKVIVKQDQTTYTITGNTYYTFIGSGATSVDEQQTGNNIVATIYTPLGAVLWGNIGGTLNNQTDLQNELDAKTNLTLFNTYTGDTSTLIGTKLNTTVFNTYTGDTQTTLTGLRTDLNTTSGQTVTNTNNISQNAANIVYLSGQTDLKLNVTDFNTYSGDTNALITGNTANIVLKPNRTDFVGSGNTTITIIGDEVRVYSPTGGTAAWGNISGSLSNQTDLQNALDAKTDNSVFQAYTGTTSTLIGTKLDSSVFNTYTGTTQTTLTGLRTDLDTTSGLTVTNASNISQNASDIVYLSGQTDLKLEITDFNTYSGNTATAIGLKASQADLVTHSGNTDIHFTQAQITGFTTTTDFVGSGDTVVTASGNTVIIYSPDDIDAVWGNITGTLANQIDLQNALNAKTDLTLFNTYTGDTSTLIGTKLAISDFNTYSASTRNDITGNTANIAVNTANIATNAAGITANTASIVANDNDIVYLSGVTDLKLNITDFNTYSGTTATAIGLKASQADLVSHTGDTGIHFEMSAITGFTSSNTFNTYTGATDTRITNNDNDITTISGITSLFYTGTTQPTGTTQLWSNTILGASAMQLSTGSTISRQVGRFYWDDQHGTASLGLKNGINLQLGQELNVYAQNQTGSPILCGQVVCPYGALGDNLLMGPALANWTVGENQLAVVTQTSVPHGECANVITHGFIRRFDTSAWSGGTVLYLSTISAGTLTEIRPDYPEQIIPCAIVVRQHATEGSIIFAPTVAYYVGIFYNYALITGNTATINAATGVTATLRTDFNTHSGDTGIHFEMSGITGFTSSNDFNTYTGTTAPATYAGLSDFNTHSGDTGIHFEMSAITGFTSSSDFNTYTGDTETAIGLKASQADLVTHSGNTGIHFEMSGITGYTTTSAFNTYTGATATSLAAKATKLAVINNITGTSYTIVAGDSNEILEASNTGATTITCPTGITSGFQCTVINAGDQVITFVAGTGATLRSKDSKVTLPNQWSAAALYWNNNNITIAGDLE